MIRLSGACLGLFAFAVAILQGLLANNPVEVVLVRALWALLLFCVLGLIVGWVAHRVLDEHAVRRHGEMFREEDEPPGGGQPTDPPASPARPSAGKPVTPASGPT